MKNRQKILITGITGQDGVFASNALIEDDPSIEILGISRSNTKNSFLKKLNYLEPNNSYENIQIINTDLNIYKNTEKILSDFNPDLIFNLSGPSSVYESLKYPNLSNQITNIFQNLTRACINLKIFPSFFQASSSEMYGSNPDHYLDETSLFLPNSPYAKAKLENHIDVESLRDSYEWNIKSGIMFNHESEFRKQDFLFSKILDFLISNPLTQKEKLTIGSTDIVRDWSYAGDIVEGMITMTKSELRSDFVLGSGKSTSIEEVLETSFNFFDLNWRDYISIDNNLLRSDDPKIRISNPKKIKKEIGWETKTSLEQTIEKITKYKMFKLQG